MRPYQTIYHRLNKLFGASEEINGGGRCPTYLFRWTVAQLPFGYKVYLHHFVGDDWSLDFHDHPKRFISIGLKGWYEEHTPVNDAEMEELAAIVRRMGEGLPGADLTLEDPICVTRHTAPWIRTFPAEWRHRICTPSGSCWTLVIVGPSTRAWGFWHAGKFIPWRQYVFAKGGPADTRKSCP